MKVIILTLVSFFALHANSQDLTNELKEAIKQDNVAQLKQALDDGKDMNTCYSSGKKTYTLLMLATKIKSFQITKYLAKKSKNIDQICIDKTALMYAVESGDLELVKILVRAGADAKKEIGDWSAIDLAVAYRHTDIKHYFNSIGIYKDYDLKGKDGPYIIDGWVYTVDQNELKKTPLDRTKSITVEVENEDKDRFEVKLRTDLKEEADVYSMPEKLIAVSDIEGNFNGFYSFLVNNGVMDKQYNWTFGKGHLVTVGDFFDRGENVTAILWLIYSLEAKAEAAGGKVHFILGNHEVMNIQADIRYVKEKYIAVAQKISKGKGVRDAYRYLYCKESELGRWLRTKNVMEKIGDYLFVHAGLHPSILDYGVSIREVNRISRKYIDVDLYRHPIENSTANFLAGAEGPLWYRGLAAESNNNGKVTSTDLQKMLNYYQVKKVVIGHTLMRDILAGYDGRVIKIDVKHGVKKNSGKTKGLLIENHTNFKINDLREREVLK